MTRTITLALVATLLGTSASLAQDAPTASAVFITAENQEIGTIELVAAEGGVHVSGPVNGIPAGEHGIHFHASGNCDPNNNFESAGDHFNPEDKKHGLENPEGPHAGDLQNVTASPEGALTLDFHSTLVSLDEGSPNYIFDSDGTALVIHAGPDDQKTDPSGNSGDRIACAVIEAAQ